MLPSTLFLDASALIKAGRSLDSGDVAILVRKAADYGVGVTVTELALHECVENHHSKLEGMLHNIESQIQSVAQATGRADLLPSLPQRIEFIRPMLEKYVQRIFEASISVIPDKNIESKNLLNDAVKKRPPFAEGDRGFRDTIILETIFDYAQRNCTGQKVFIVSDDQLFLEGAAMRKAAGVEVIALPSKDALVELEKGLEDHVKAIQEAEERATIEFLNANTDEIYAHVEKMSISESLLKLGNSGLQNATVRRVHEAKPLGVSWAHPKLYYSRNEATGTRIPIWFGVRVVLTLEVESWIPLWAFGPEIPLTGHAEVQRSWSEPRPLQISQAEIQHDVHVHARATVVQEGHTGLAELELLTNEQLAAEMVKSLQDGEAASIRGLADKLATAEGQTNQPA